MMRKPLGRGLDALIGNPAAGIETGGDDNGDSQFRMAPVGSITAGEFQPRINFDKERLAELTRAIQSQGIIEPLIVRRIDAVDADGPRYELIAGERRLRAARAAGLETVPVVVRELDDRAALEMSLVENIVREDLNAVEEGLAFFRLVDHFDLSHDDIAARVGKSRPYVSNSIRLLELPQPILEHDREGGAHRGTGAAAALDRIVRQAADGGAANCGGRNLVARRRGNGDGESAAHESVQCARSQRRQSECTRRGLAARAQAQGQDFQTSRAESREDRDRLLRR